MKYLPGIIAFSLLLTACSSNSSQETAVVDSTGNIDIDGSVSNICYQSMAKKDTIKMAFNTIGEDFTGTLCYNLYEKDRNEGTVVGKVKHDTLLADYTFMSEGQESVRQVIFLKKQDQLIEGFGAMKEVDGKMVFENYENIQFGKSIVLEKIDCE